MTFVQIFVKLGISLLGTRQVVEARYTRAPGRFAGFITQARLTLCMLAGVGCAAIGVFVPIIRESALYVSLIYIAACGRALAPDFLFQGKEQMAPITVRYFLSKDISTALTVVPVHSMADILWVPVLDITASAIALAWLFSSAHKMFGLKIKRVDSRAHLSELARLGYCRLSI